MKTIAENLESLWDALVPFFFATSTTTTQGENR
jgi:hypothetical protein